MRSSEPSIGPAPARAPPRSQLYSPTPPHSPAPAPEVNARLANLEVDFLWRRERLVVEVDGYRYHADRTAFETDRRRDAELSASGYRVIRVTWRQLNADRDPTLARLAMALATR